MAVQKGDAFPAFTAPKHDGGTVNLADYKGKQNLVVFFFPRANTPG